ncbi:HNH endonuclease [Georgenia satyanarayanai]|uniref:HNH endonuclease signature motif containing protein n=1 Tax=Georgenia satyanarayanai TaxID=860221 RepID=UPI002040DDB2|nr:HNH endonuclease signature motif containing protein [Georgenia satyanarayanai]MCM3659647.1 HNH endonuclease [Georgenia satyanarayanai]
MAATQTGGWWLTPADLAGPPPCLVPDDGPAQLPALPPDPLPPGAGPDERWAEEVPLEDDGPPELPPLPPDPLLPAGRRGNADVLDDDDGAELGGLLTSLAPGPALAAALEALGPRAVSLYALVEMVAGYQRLASWATARAIELSGAVAGRPGINPHHPLPGGKIAADCAAAELAPRLGITRFAARRMVGDARLFRDKLAQTAQALRLGLVNPAKAAVLTRHLADQPADVAWEVQRVILPDAPHQTPSQLTRAVEKAIIAIDPNRAVQRHRRAREERRVDHPRPLPDGMASIHAFLPATDAAGFDLALEAAARSAKAAGDSRTIDQLRADVFALMGHTALEQGYIGLPEPSDTDAAAAAGTDAVPSAEAGGEGSREVDADDGVPAAPSAATGTPDLQPVSDYLRMLHMPMGTIGGRRAVIRIDVPLSVLVLPPETQGAFPAYGECWDHLTADSHAAPGASPAHDPPGDSPADDGPLPMAEVAELEGYGPITPDVARALAMSAGTWQRIVTDPLSGEVLDVGRTRYRPPAALAEFVRARDRSCVIPGCSTPAHSCDLDHVVPFPEGPTSASNLGAGCRPDHTIKTLGRFRLEHLGAGTFCWTTPSGHVYQRDHHGRVTWVRTGAGSADAAEPPF